MYIFKYISDGNAIYRKGSYVGTYEQFISINLGFPMKKEESFEYSDEGFDVINSQGHHMQPEDLTPYEKLITAINNLGE